MYAHRLRRGMPLLLMAILGYILGCQKPGQTYRFVVASGYEGKLMIEESVGGVDAFTNNHLRFDFTGKLLVKDIDFLDRWNRINFSFEDGRVIHREDVVNKVRGAYYISSGGMNQDRVVVYVLRRYR